MSKKTHQVDASQMPFDWTSQIDELIEIKCDLFEAAGERKPVTGGSSNEFEDCIEIAVAIKRCLRESGMNREQLVDGINAYFGRTEEGAKADPPTCRNPLTIHMFNNYLSKPCEYPIPAYFLFSIQAVTGIIEPAATIVAAAGGQVATAQEVKLLQLGKLEQTIDDLQRLKREIKGGGKR